MIPIHLIVAMTHQRVIGHKGALPWELPEDLQLFRRLTMGKTLLGGRKTYESIGRPLDGRLNLALSTSAAAVVGLAPCRTVDEALAQAAAAGSDLFVIGGASVYRQLLPLADWLHISWVDRDYPGDTHFPSFTPSDWSEDACCDYPGFRHCTYRRK